MQLVKSLFTIPLLAVAIPWNALAIALTLTAFGLLKIVWFMTAVQNAITMWLTEPK